MVSSSRWRAASAWKSKAYSDQKKNSISEKPNKANFCALSQTSWNTKTEKTTPNTNQFTLTSVHSEGQFNTIIYSEEDVYRRQSHRQLLFISAEDLEMLELKAQDKADVSNATGTMRSLELALYDIKPGNVMCYFPKASILVLQSVIQRSRAPSFISNSVSIKEAAA